MNNSRLSNLTKHMRRGVSASWIVPPLLLALSATAQAQFTYTINNGAVTITGYTGGMGTVTIPSVINGLPVTGISSFAANHVREVTIPESVINITPGAFSVSPVLWWITVMNGNPAYSSLEGVLFNKSQTTLCEFPRCKAVIDQNPWPAQTSYTIPNTVTNITIRAFQFCGFLTNITIPNSVPIIGDNTFDGCFSLTSMTIPNSVTSIGSEAFYYCTDLASVTIGSGVTSIGWCAFYECSNLTRVTIHNNSVTNIGDEAFRRCINLQEIYFQGNAPSLGYSVFYEDSNATVYYLPGTTGWGATFGGLPTALWPPPTIQRPPQTQTAETGSAVEFSVAAGSVGNLVLGYQWFFNGTNRLSCTNSVLQLADVQYSQAGAYTVVVTNAAGSVTSPPALLSVIAPVERRIVPALTLMGQPGTSLNLDFAAALGPAPLWTTFDHVPLTAASQWYFDLSSPLPQQGFYRVWQLSPGTPPALNLHFVPALTLAGAIGSSVRVDYINQFGLIDAWVTNLATVTLTNTTQLYFDVSSIGQPPRLWRLVPAP